MIFEDDGQSLVAPLSLIETVGHKKRLTDSSRITPIFTIYHIRSN